MYRKTNLPVNMGMNWKDLKTSIRIGVAHPRQNSLTTANGIHAIASSEPIKAKLDHPKLPTAKNDKKKMFMFLNTKFKKNLWVALFILLFFLLICLWRNQNFPESHNEIQK